MKHVSIIVPQGDFILSSLVGTHKVFMAANRYQQEQGLPPLFDVHLVGITPESTLYGGLFAVRPDTALSTVIKTNLIIIPSIQPHSLDQNKEFIPWIIEQYKLGAEVASLCIGAFLLAATGLLNGKTCSTHWIAANGFRQAFPGVHLMTEKVLTDEHGIYTSGGAFTFLNLILYIVEKHGGRKLVIYLSKVLEIEIDRSSQSPFDIFLGQKEHEDGPIKEAQTYIENNVSERILVDQLASRFALSRRNFERRFKKATSNTPVEYLQRVKIEAAKKLLENGRENVNEVMYSVGYSDNKAFRTIFKKITGLSPLDYRKKYNREMAVA